MLYLLDANVLIDADRYYYPIQKVPEFWEWLVHVGTKNLVKIPFEIYDEIKEGKGEMAEWARGDEASEALLLEEEADVLLVSRVTDEGYAPDLTDDEVVKIGRDPFLVAYALRVVDDRCVVTTEVPKPSMQRANRRLPDVCDGFGVKHCDTFKFLQELNFRTGWRTAT